MADDFYLSNQLSNEPLRKYRWYLQFTQKLKGTIIALKECSKPEYEIGVTEHRILNRYVRLPGIIKWKPINIKFASMRGDKRVKDVAMILYNATLNGGYTGAAYRGDTMKKNFMNAAVEGNRLNLLQLDAEGQKIEYWSLHEPMLTRINFGNLSYDSDDIVDIECTLTYDYACLNEKKYHNLIDDAYDTENITAEAISKLKLDPAKEGYRFANRYANLSANITKESQYVYEFRNKLEDGYVGIPNNTSGSERLIDKYTEPTVKVEKRKDFNDLTMPFKGGGELSKRVLGALRPDLEYDVIPSDGYGNSLSGVDSRSLARLISQSTRENRRNLSGDPNFSEFSGATESGASELNWVPDQAIKDANAAISRQEAVDRETQAAADKALKDLQMKDSLERMSSRREQEKLGESILEDSLSVSQGNIRTEYVTAPQADFVSLTPEQIIKQQEAQDLERRLLETKQAFDIAEAEKNAQSVADASRELEALGMASASEAITPSSTASDAPTLYETTFEAEFAGVNFSKPPDEQPEYSLDLTDGPPDFNEDLETVLNQRDGQQIIDDLSVINRDNYVSETDIGEPDRIEYVTADDPSRNRTPNIPEDVTVDAEGREATADSLQGVGLFGVRQDESVFGGAIDPNNAAGSLSGPSTTVEATPSSRGNTPTDEGLGLGQLVTSAPDEPSLLATPDSSESVADSEDDLEVAPLIPLPTEQTPLENPSISPPDDEDRSFLGPTPGEIPTTVADDIAAANYNPFDDIPSPSFGENINISDEQSIVEESYTFPPDDEDRSFLGPTPSDIQQTIADDIAAANYNPFDEIPSPSFGENITTSDEQSIVEESYVPPPDDEDRSFLGPTPGNIPSTVLDDIAAANYNPFDDIPSPDISYADTSSQVTNTSPDETVTGNTLDNILKFLKDSESGKLPASDNPVKHPDESETSEE